MADNTGFTVFWSCNLASCCLGRAPLALILCVNSFGHRLLVLVVLTTMNNVTDHFLCEINIKNCHVITTCKAYH